MPEAKTAKSRLHLESQPKDQAAEVTRLEALGARRADVGQSPDVAWIVLADPDGNEFCALRAFRPEELADQAGGWPGGPKYAHREMVEHP